jgi:hypothetical protein
MVAAAATSLFLQLRWTEWNADDPREFAYLMLTTVVVTTAAWLAVTFLTPPEPRERLEAFYRRARPAGPGWNSVRGRLEHDAPPTESLGEQFRGWIFGCVLIYASLFGIGYLVLKEWVWGAGLMMLALACAAAISRQLSRAAGRERTTGS